MRILSDAEAGGEYQSGPHEEQEPARSRINLGGIRSVIAFASAKGGVGKSTLLVNVAAALALKGRKVGIADLDVNAPSITAMLGLRRPRVFSIGDQIDPANGPLGLRVIASNVMAESHPPPPSFTDDEPAPITSNGAAPVQLSGPQMIRRLLAQTRFGTLDFLLIDLAPGLGELRQIAELVALGGIVLVSHPSELGVSAARAALKAAAETSTPVIGIVENMAGFYCGNCHSVRPLLPQGEMSALVRESGVTVLSRLSFDPRLAESCDSGMLFVHDYADAPLAKQIGELAGRLDEHAGAPQHKAQV
ncbi:MAG: P-loop NTPase [Candidatus Binataceae bacterium]